MATSRSPLSLSEAAAAYFNDARLEIGVCGGFTEVADDCFMSGGAEGKVFVLFKESIKYIESFNTAEEFLAELALARNYKKAPESKAETKISLSVEVQERYEKALSAAALIEGMVVYLRPEKFAEALQGSIKYGQHNPEELSALLQSIELKEAGGRQKILTFNGIYPSLSHFKQYENFLKYTADKTPCDLSFRLDGIGHQVKLLYDSPRKRWIGIDLNSPVAEISEDKLHIFIRDAFQEKLEGFDSAFSTSLSVAGKNSEQKEFQAFCSELKASKNFLNETLVTEEKAKHIVMTPAIGNVTGIALIHLAAVTDDVAIVKKIAELKGELNVKQSNRITPIATAIIYDNYDFLSCYLNEMYKRGYINADTMDDICPGDEISNLLLAIKHQCHDIVTLLYDYGASLESTDENKQTPLHYAVVYNMDLSIVQLLVRGGAALNSVDTFGKRPIDLADDASIVAFLNEAMAHDTLLISIERMKAESKRHFPSINTALNKVSEFIHKNKGAARILDSVRDQITSFSEDKAVQAILQKIISALPTLTDEPLLLILEKNCSDSECKLLGINLDVGLEVKHPPRPKTQSGPKLFSKLKPMTSNDPLPKDHRASTKPKKDESLPKLQTPSSSSGQFRVPSSSPSTKPETKKPPLQSKGTFPKVGR